MIEMKKETVSRVILVMLLLSMLILLSNIQRASSSEGAWIPQTSGTPHDLKAVTCTDANKAWTVGIMGTILNTVDGGMTWEAQPSGTDWHLYDVTFINDNEGWVVGEEGTILHTEDGGSSWHPQNSGTINLLRSVCFLDNMTGWTVGDAVILHTTNGGDLWEDQMNGVPENYRDEQLNTVFFRNASVGWAGGNIWDEIVLHTNDGGVSWSAANPCPGHRIFGINDIYFTDSDNGWILDGDRVMHTVDSGESWELYVIQRHYDDHWIGWTSVVFPERNTGWLAGTYGVILHTIDRAYSWVKQSTGTNVTLHDLCFADVNTGWAVGDQGAILSYAEDAMHPVASLNYEPKAPYIGGGVFFNASSSYDPDGTIDSYHWDFGDGKTGTGTTVTHAYMVEGDYHVILTVTDNDGLTATMTDVVTVSSVSMMMVKLSGEHDYLLKERIEIRCSALVRDAETMEPISNANVTIEIYGPNGNLWISDVMVERLVGTGIYQWHSNQTIRELRLAKGIYFVHVQTSFKSLKTSDILQFHIDPPSDGSILSSTPLIYYVTAVALIAAGTLTGITLLRRYKKQRPDSKRINSKYKC